MNLYADKTRDELISELEELRTRYNSFSQIIESENATRLKERSRMEELISVSEDFISFSSDTPDYQKISRVILDLSGGKYVSFNVFDEEGKGFTTVAVAGLRDNIKKAISMLGFEVVNVNWPYDPWRFEKTRNQSITRFEHLHELTRDIVPRTIIDLLSKAFNVGETYIIKIAKEDKVLGDFTIFFAKGESLVNESLVNLFAHQVGMFLDRNNVTKALKYRESLFRLLAENSTDMIARHSLNGTFLYVSPSCRVLLGWEQEDLIGKQSLELVHPEDQQKVIDSLTEIVKRPAIMTVEFRIRCKDGRYSCFETISRTILNPETGSINEIHCSSRDITKRKIAETSLLESRANLAAIIENTTSSIWLINRSYELLYINSVFETAFLNSYGILLKPGMNILNAIPPSIKEEWRFRYDKVLRNERIIFEEKFVFGNSVFYFEISMNPIVVENEVIGASVFSREITDRKQVEQELINAKERAEESDRLKSAFLANMSHEIRTPMNGILGFAELLKEPDLSGEDQSNYIRIIEKSGARMVNIINDIIDISRIESGQMKVSAGDTNINEQTEYIYNFFKPEVEQKGMKIICNNTLSAEESVVRTDREKLYAILTNLVKNAIKYSDSGVIEIGYDLKNIGRHSFLEFYVKDTGIGIPMERHSAIFERFVQADISDKRALQGAGLGLAISKAFVEMLGGKIRVESAPGKGSVFFFTIPYTKKGSSVSLNENIPGAVLRSKDVDNLKILIAEDDEISEMYLSKTLRPFSRKIMTAKTGAEAVELCRNTRDIDLILMDIQMPDLDGYDAIKEIRKFNSKVFIIAQTAFALSGDKDKALVAGADDYVSKPIKIDELHSIINKHFMLKK